MRFPLIPALILLIFNIFVDAAVYSAIVRYLHRGILSKIQLYTSILLSLAIIVVVCLPKRNGSDDQLVVVMWALYAYLTIYLPKIIFLIFYYISRLPNLWHRRSWRKLTVTGAVVAVIMFVLMWWGALINRNRIDVNRKTVEMRELPQAFDGFTIAQISDIHVGTYGKDTAFVSKLVDSVNALHPDVIVFTGDIVNRHSQEVDPFMLPLSRLDAPYGVYSVMGNHDYGDYSDWENIQDKAQDVAMLKEKQSMMGWHMLNNETEWIKRGPDSIALIGVENIGDPPFKTYGDLTKAYNKLDDPNIKILLTHNPAHWEKDISNNPKTNVALTLSGHTHAMQMTCFGTSPAALRYDHWGGMYEDDKNQRLYVNIGAGTVGMPYRIGATPEITLITLKRPNK